VRICEIYGWEPVRKSRGRAKIWLDNGIDFNLLETYIKPSSGIFCPDGGFIFSNTLSLNILEKLLFPAAFFLPHSLFSVTFLIY
jgi:hypothetical protein